MNYGGQVYKITDDYMKSNYVKTLEYEWIENLIYFLCVYPIVAMINYGISKNENMLYLNLLTIIPIFIMTYLRMKIKKMRNFIIGIMGVMTISLITIGLLLKQYVFLVLLIVWAIDCIKRSTSKQRVQFNKFSLLIVQALLIPQIIIATVVEIKDYQVLADIISIVIMLISIGYICKARNVRLSMDDVENESFNKKDSNIFISGTILLLAVFIFLLYKLGTFELAYYLNKKTFHIFSDIANGKINELIEAGKNLMAQANPDALSQYIENSRESQGEINQTVIKFFHVILNILAVLSVISISYLLINRILIYVKKLRNTDKITFVFNNNNENDIKKKVNKLRYNISKSIFLNDKEKIRKLYKDKILKYKKNKITINNFLSTNEIRKEILSKACDNIEDVTTVYEKARYSNEKITKDDIEILKNKKR